MQTCFEAARAAQKALEAWMVVDAVTEAKAEAESLVEIVVTATLKPMELPGAAKRRIRGWPDSPPEPSKAARARPCRGKRK